MSRPFTARRFPGRAVAVLGGRLPESTETFTVTVDGPTNAYVGDVLDNLRLRASDHRGHAMSWARPR